MIDALSDHRVRAVLDTTDAIDLELVRYYFETSANSSLQIQAFKKLYALDAPQAEKSFKNVFLRVVPTKGRRSYALLWN